MKRTAFTLLSALALVVSVSAAQGPRPAGKTLDIYVVDTEGGEAILFIAPSGETLLMDSGNPGARDHERIMEVLKTAGVTKLDYLLSTHYHVDHIGGMALLAAAVPIGTYVDHGPSSEEREQVPGFQATYAALKAKAKSIVVKPGDRLPIAGLDWRIVTSAAKSLATPLSGAPGAGQANPACAQSQPKNQNPLDENGWSVGSHVTYGQFRTIHLGDLLWDRELDLMCPQNKVGTVDLYIVSHHGTDTSGSPALVHGLRPRVAVMENGTRKGGTIQTATTLRSSANLEDIWQLHWSYNAMIEHNPSGIFIANVDDMPTIAGILTAPARGGGPAGGRAGGGPGAGPQGPPVAGGPALAAPQVGANRAGGPVAAPPQAGAPQPGPAVAPPQGMPAAPAPGGGPTGVPAPGAGRGGGGAGGGAAAAHSPAHWIKISAQADGTFTVTNSRNNFSKTYTKR